LPIQNIEVKEKEAHSMNEPSTSSFDSDKLDKNMMVILIVKLNKYLLENKS